MNTAILMLLIFVGAVVLSWLLTKRIIVRWMEKLEPTERVLLGVCVFAVMFFVVAGIAIGAASVYRHFAREVGSAISETVDAFEEEREEGDSTEKAAVPEKITERTAAPEKITERTAAPEKATEEMVAPEKTSVEQVDVDEQATVEYHKKLETVTKTEATGESVSVGRPITPELVSVRPVSSEGKCCSATDLVFFNDRWICVFREGSAYVSPDGVVRVYESLDGKLWKRVGVVRLFGYDLRDPKICVTPTDQLMLSFGAAKRAGGKLLELATNVSLSPDGKKWSDPVVIGQPRHWISQLCWDSTTCYGAGYFPDSKRQYVSLYRSKDGKKFVPLVGTLYADGSPSESALYFELGGNALCIIRRGGNHPVSAVLGLASRPFTDWTWKTLNKNVAGPDVARLPDGRYIVAGRLTDGNKRTALCWLDVAKAKLTEFLPLPSGGVNGYPGMVFHDNELWVSYFSSHEDKTSVYVAKVRLYE
jgi:hypothetical protein